MKKWSNNSTFVLNVQETLRIKQLFFYMSDFQIGLTVGIDLTIFNRIVNGKLLKFAQKFWLKLERWHSPYICLRLFSSSSWGLPVYFAILCLTMHCHMAAEVRFFDVLSISYLLHPFVHRLALKAVIRLDQLGPLFFKTGQEIVGAITKHIKSILRSVTV